nr:Chain B, Nuclear receptor coactivator 5 [Homo sapiens]
AIESLIDLLADN